MSLDDALADAALLKSSTGSALKDAAANAAKAESSQALEDIMTGSLSQLEGLWLSLACARCHL